MSKAFWLSFWESLIIVNWFLFSLAAEAKFNCELVYWVTKAGIVAVAWVSFTEVREVFKPFTDIVPLLLIPDPDRLN